MPPLHSPERALRPAPRPTFSRRESRQRYARNLLVPGPPAKGASPPLIPRPSALAVLVAGNKTLKHPRDKAPAAPRIENRECSLDETKGKNKTDLPTNSKWQIGLVLWQKVARRETERSAASAKRAVRDGYSFQFNGFCVPSLEPDCVRFPKFC